MNSYLINKLLIKLIESVLALKSNYDYLFNQLRNYMQQLFSVLLILSVIFTACNTPELPLDENSISIKGQIKGSKDTPFIAAYIDTIGELRRDTIFLKNDKFHFTTNCIQEGVQTITIYASGNDFKVTFLGTNSYFVLSPSQTKVKTGKHYKVNGNYRSYSTMTWSGSDYVEQKSEYNLRLQTLTIKRDSLFALWNRYNEDDYNALVTPTLDVVKNQIRAQTDLFIQDHLDYEFSVELILKYYSSDVVKLEEYWSQLNNDTKKTSSGIQMYEKIELARKIEVGATAPDFTLKDSQGKDMVLSAYKGKVVLLDFWGAWCLPCRATHPFLIELHKKYNKQGFEILGIGNGSSVERWQKAIEDDKIKIWRHAFASGIKDYDIFKTYNITAFPTKILINKAGVITNVFIGDDHQEDMIIALEKAL